MLSFSRHLAHGLGLLSLVLLASCGGGGGGGDGDSPTISASQTASSSTTTSAGASSSQQSSTSLAASSASSTSSAASTASSTASTSSVSTSIDTSSSSVSSVSAAVASLSWAAPASITYGTALSASQLNATSTSAGSFSYSPAAGTLLNAGTYTLSVTFTPTDSTKAKLSGSVTLTVNKAKPTITWDTPMPGYYNAWLKEDRLKAKASVAGSFEYSPKAGTQLTTFGEITLKTTFTPTDTSNYETVTATQAMKVVKRTPDLSWSMPDPIVQGTALSATQLNATGYSGIGKLTYSPASGAVMSTSGTTVLTATFTPNDTEKYDSATISTVLTVVPATGTAMVDFGDSAKGQIIRGFGASSVWRSKYADARMRKLFSTEGDGLGLSILRVRIAPAAWDVSKKTATESEWKGELDNAKTAQALGARIFATPWTPPVSLKTNNDSRDSKLFGGNLKTDGYADYALYLNAFIKYATNQGVNLYAISMQNEPDENPEYESCLWTPEWMADWTADHAGNAVGSTGVKFIMPESIGFSARYSDAALKNSRAKANIDIVGGHLYGPGPNYPKLAKESGKETWMTEHFLHRCADNDSASKDALCSGDDPDMLRAAKEIHDSMTLGQYNAYVWWWLVNTDDAKPRSLIDTSDNLTRFGLAMKHFSRYIRPDYYRYDASSQPVKGVYMSAYAGSSRKVLVVINTNSSAVSLPVQLKNASISTLTPYQTTTSASFQQLASVAVTNNAFTASLPARSVTTYVQ